MKVWEKCNEVKGTSVSIEQIANWAYMNRICPLMFDVGLDIDTPYKDGYPIENGFLATAREICEASESGKKCGFDCLMKYLNSEYKEVKQ